MEKVEILYELRRLVGLAEANGEFELAKDILQVIHTNIPPTGDCCG
jgi:hypothetical protein